MNKYRKHSKTRFGVCRECKVRDNDSSPKKLIQCRFCKEFFCKKHLPPRLSISREMIEKINDVVLRDKIYTEWRKPDGHPDPVWTEKYFNSIKLSEEERRRKFYEFLERPKLSYEPPQHVPKPKSSGIHIKVPRLYLKKIFRQIAVWYGIYLFLVVLLSYLTMYNKDIYFTIIPFMQYPFYILSAFLGGYIPYKLFKKYEYKPLHSDLQIWGLKLIAGLIAGVSIIILVFEMMFLMSALLSTVGKEIAYGISIFLGVLFFGLMLFSAYLMFKYQMKSGIIIHRGEGWK